MDFTLLLVLLSPVLSVAAVTQVLDLQPRLYVSNAGGRATFICLALSGARITSLQWLLNGSLVENLNLSSVTQEFDVRIGVLTFVDIPVEYNMTRITCVATFDSSESNTTRDSQLLVQGFLSAVNSLNIITTSDHDSVISLTWTPPFTLDITGVYPDIAGYCVDVMIINFTPLSTFSQCGINMTELSYPLPPDSACYNFVFSITPVNLVGNGTSTTVSYTQAEVPGLIGEAVLVAANSTSFTLTYLLAMSAPVCNVSLIFTDVDAGKHNVLIKEGNGLTIMKNNISFTSEQLALNRQYNVTIIAANIAGSAISCTTISTHDVIMATATETQNNEIAVTAVYSEHSDASGVLFSFVFITDSGDVDFGRSLLLAFDRNTSHNYTLPFDLYPGHYRVYVYDIEHNGILSNGVGYPAVRSELTISNGMGCLQPLQPFNCTTNSSSGLIWAKCSYSNCSSVTGFQVVAQLSDASEVHKLYVNQSTGLQTPVTVLVERAGLYHVSIFAKEGMGILDLNVQYTELVMVHAPSIVSTTAGMPDHISTTPGNASTRVQVGINYWITIGLGIALGVITLVAVIMTGTTTVLCCKLRSQGSTEVQIKARIPLAVIPEGEATTIPVDVTAQQLYEEIGDVAPNIVAPRSDATHHVEYEDVRPAAESGGNYHFTLCSAYGVPIDN